jgi:hypothetical protein
MDVGFCYNSCVAIDTKRAPWRENPRAEKSKRLMMTAISKKIGLTATYESNYARL